MKSRQVFAARLKEIRLQEGKSQKEFADMVQSTAATISAYENATKNPSLEIVMNIAEKCNVSIDWLSGLSDQKELKPTIRNYKDIALKILELCSIDMFSVEFELKTYKVDCTEPELSIPGEWAYYEEWALSLPSEHKFIDFISTYKELNGLYKSGRIKQDVIDTWIAGALEELKAIPIKILNKSANVVYSNIPSESRGNPLISLIRKDAPQE